jgi:hypothetical protein
VPAVDLRLLLLLMAPFTHAQLRALMLDLRALGFFVINSDPDGSCGFYQLAAWLAGFFPTVPCRCLFSDYGCPMLKLECSQFKGTVKGLKAQLWQLYYQLAADMRQVPCVMFPAQSSWQWAWSSMRATLSQALTPAAQTWWSWLQRAACGWTR